ncbi:hypothetical protein QYM36_009274, partial [Artemia franciscana]
MKLINATRKKKKNQLELYALASSRRYPEYRASQRYGDHDGYPPLGSRSDYVYQHGLGSGSYAGYADSTGYPLDMAGVYGVDPKAFGIFGADRGYYASMAITVEVETEALGVFESKCKTEKARIRADLELQLSNRFEALTDYSDIVDRWFKLRVLTQEAAEQLLGHAKRKQRLRILGTTIELVEKKRPLLIVIPVHKKGDATVCPNYRGMSLIDRAMKVISIIVLNRFKNARDKLTGPEQAGFRPDRGRLEHILTLRLILQQSERFQLSAIITFIDFVAAFDSLIRTELWKIMVEDSVPAELIEILKGAYDMAPSPALIAERPPTPPSPSERSDSPPSHRVLAQ